MAKYPVPRSHEARASLLQWIDRVLENEYHSPNHGNLRDPTCELFYLLLTVKTRITVVRPYYRQLRRAYPSWNELADARTEDLVGLVLPLGMAQKRAELLVKTAQKIKKDFGRVSLHPLQKASTSEAIRYLVDLPGVGEKVARCVCLYGLGRDISPMDSNAIRVLSRVGVLPRGTTPAASHKLIDRLIQQGRSYPLHVNLVAHGQRVCSLRKPKCEACKVNRHCRYFRTGS